MNLTLKNKIKLKAKRNTKKNSIWYKESSGGVCPEVKPNKPIYSSYRDIFKCNINDQPYIKLSKYKAAAQCASERMAEMKYIIETGQQPDKGHILPIQLAYAFGKECASLLTPKNSNYYLIKTRQWYNQLKEGELGNKIHELFTNNLSNQYPLESFTPNNQLHIIQPSILKKTINGGKRLYLKKHL